MLTQCKCKLTLIVSKTPQSVSDLLVNGIHGHECKKVINKIPPLLPTPLAKWRHWLCCQSVPVKPNPTRAHTYFHASRSGLAPCSRSADFLTDTTIRNCYACLNPSSVIDYPLGESLRTGRILFTCTQVRQNRQTDWQAGHFPVSSRLCPTAGCCYNDEWIPA